VADYLGPAGLGQLSKIKSPATPTALRASYELDAEVPFQIRI